MGVPFGSCFRRLLCTARAGGGRSSPAFSGCGVLRRFFSRSTRAFRAGGSSEMNSGATRFGKADRNRLFARANIPTATFKLLHLLSNKFTSGGGRFLSLTLIFLGFLNSRFSRHAWNIVLMSALSYGEIVQTEQRRQTRLSGHINPRTRRDCSHGNKTIAASSLEFSRASWWETCSQN